MIVVLQEKNCIINTTKMYVNCILILNVLGLYTYDIDIKSIDG